MANLFIAICVSCMAAIITCEGKLAIGRGGEKPREGVMEIQRRQLYALAKAYLAMYPGTIYYV